MRHTIFFISFFSAFLVAPKVFAYSCKPKLKNYLTFTIFPDSQEKKRSRKEKKQLNVLDLTFQNDVVFVGELYGAQKNGRTYVYTYRVIETLKGLPAGTETLILKSNSSIKYKNREKKEVYREPPDLLFARYEKNSELVMTDYDCEYIPRQEAMISFLKGPYRYRYLILVLVSFVIFSIWRVGGFRNFLTADLKSLFGAVFWNKPLEISKNPSNLRNNSGFIILYAGLCYLILFIASYLRFYGFF